MAGPAQAHVRAVVAAHGGDAAGIVAHTSADLLAGVRPAA